MRFSTIVRMSAKQKLRDRFALALSLLTAPLFVLFYWILFHDSSQVYQIQFLDDSLNTNASHIAHIQTAMNSVAKQQGGYTFLFSLADNRRQAVDSLKSKKVDAVVSFLSFRFLSVQNNAAPTIVKFIGDASSPRFQFCSAIMEKTVSDYIAQIAPKKPTISFVTEPIGLSAHKTPFESYVPGLLVFAVIMLIFSSAMSVVKEIENGTFARLRMTPVGIFELVGGFSLVQLTTGILSVIITFGTAWSLGFQSEGSLILAITIASVACMASVGIGMVVAGLSKTQGKAFLLSSIIMFLLVLFSGIIFPKPVLTLFQVGERSMNLIDLLPTAHLGNALDKVLTLGATFTDVRFELSVLLLIAVFNYVIGSLIFIRSGKPATTTWEGML